MTGSNSENSAPFYASNIKQQFRNAQARLLLKALIKILPTSELSGMKAYDPPPIVASSSNS